MTSLLIVFFSAIFLILVIMFPFKIRLMSHLNLIEMKGYYSFKVWRLKLLCGMIFLNDSGKIEVTNANNMLKGYYNKNFVTAVSKEILKSIDVEKIELFFTVGYAENSFMSAMLCGGVSSFVQTLYGYLSLNYENVRLYEDIKPTYNESNFELTFDGVMKISILQICVSLIKAQKIKNKLEKSENEG